MSYEFRRHHRTVSLRHLCSILLICLVLSSLVAVSNQNNLLALALQPGYSNVDYQNNDSNIKDWANIPLTIPIDQTLDNYQPAAHDITTKNVSDEIPSFQSTQSSDQLQSLAICNKLPISAVPSASGNDGNVPSNVLDNNLNTRWSDLGQGSWIQLDLGSEKSICSVDIAWYRGDMRENNFVISVSNDDNTFTNKFTGTSSGLTISPEKYNMPAGTEGRYVRITVNGNTENDWASITEIAVFGSEGGSSPLPPSISSPGPLYHRWQNTAGSTTSWSTWTSLSGALKSSPEVAINSDGRLEVFVLGSNNALYHRWQNTAGSTTSWSSWVSLSGNLAGNPAVAMNSDGRLEVFAIGANNQLYHRWQNTAGSSNSWSQWVSLGGTLISNPAVTINSDGRLEVFAIGANNQLYHRWQNTPGSSSSSWSAWTSLGGTLTGDPAVARNSDGRLEVFVIGATNNALYHKWQNSPSSSSSWSSYHSLGGSLKGDPAVARNADGRLEVFVIGATNSALYHKWQNTAGTTTSWSAYHSLGGSISSNPAVGVNQGGRLEVFVVGANGNALYHKWQNTAGTTTSWSAYHSLGGTIAGDPGVARNSDGRLEAFVIGGGGSGGGGGDSGTNDKFGIKKIYATKSSGEEWYMNMQNPNNDPRTSEPSMSQNSDGSWRVTSGQVRYGVFTSSGYQPGNVVKDHSVIANRGYMQSPNDWKNVEMTGQVKYNSGGDDEWTWYARGGRHTGSGWENGCEGVAIKGSLAYSGGDVRWAKEQWHVSYVFQPWKNSPADGDGKFVGFKVAIYNMQLNGKTVVKMESWVDPNNNNQWQKVYDFIDQGGWGSQGGECRGASGQIVTWGGPIAAFRWDDGNSIDIKNLSVREIVPPA